ncbi:ABC transporter permease [Candidatus Entotheonella serta]|nr:ABC transporter permease [Candidatus Entotheonella serta]
MLRTSLFFLCLAVILLAGFADVEITTLDPWNELSRLAWGALTPQFFRLPEIWPSLLNTVAVAFGGIFLACMAGSLLAFGFHWTPVWLACAWVRAIHELFWAFLLMPLVGLNPLCAVLAIAVPYTGIFAKVYTEIQQESNQQPLQGVPAQTGWLSRFCYGILPVIYPDIKHYTAYRFECGLRSSAIMGFIGLPTLGFHLETAFREGMYAEVWAILYAFFLLIASLKLWVKPRLVALYVIASFAFFAQDIYLSWDNIYRFVTYDILPWPMRRDGVYTGTQAVSFAWGPVWGWLQHIWYEEALEGIWNTLILTQIVLAGTAVVALLQFPGISRHFANTGTRWGMQGWLILLRTTPEYILAYVGIQLWGPSMLPAVVAISLHNGAILAYLSGQNADLVTLTADASKRQLNRYFYEILPRVYGQFLAFLFYRWEVMMRESAILGILGVYTLGFYIDSAISDNQLDKAIVLIVITALLNIGIDTISQFVRRRLKVSARLVMSEKMP